jgi:hypothetical protein
MDRSWIDLPSKPMPVALGPALIGFFNAAFKALFAPPGHYCMVTQPATYPPEAGTPKSSAGACARHK